MKCIELFEAEQEVCNKRVFKLQSLLEKVFVHRYSETKVQEGQSIGKEKIKVFG